MNKYTAALEIYAPSAAYVLFEPTREAGSRVYGKMMRIESGNWKFSVERLSAEKFSKRLVLL